MSNQLSRNTLRVSLAILLALAASPVWAQQQQRRATSNALAAQSTNEAATVVFRAARDLITDGEWAKAQDKFSDYVNSYPNEKNLDAALYWMAYAQHKLARFDQCRTTIARLLEKYPSSSWRDDARTLMAQVPGAVIVAAQADEMMAQARSMSPVAIARPADGAVVYAPALPGVATGIGATAIAPLPAQGIGTTTVWNGIDGFDGPESDDDPCEFKIVVLQALFQTDLQRGIVAATDWLKPGSNQTVRCKSAALTLLGRNGGKAVTPVILGVARNETDLKLRARAISTLGAIKRRQRDRSAARVCVEFDREPDRRSFAVCVEQAYKRSRHHRAQRHRHQRQNAVTTQTRDCQHREPRRRSGG